MVTSLLFNLVMNMYIPTHIYIYLYCSRTVRLMQYAVLLCLFSNRWFGCQGIPLTFIWIKTNTLACKHILMQLHKMTFILYFKPIIKGQNLRKCILVTMVNSSHRFLKFEVDFILHHFLLFSFYSLDLSDTYSLTEH